MSDDRDDYPEFFDHLDDDPRRAMRLFTQWVLRQVKEKPPRILAWLDAEDRQDALHDVILHCADDNFRRLRLFKPQGTPFGGWFYQVMRNFIVSKYDPGKGIEVLSLYEEGGDVLHSHHGASDPERARMLALVREHVRKLGAKCRRLLTLAAYEFKPREVARLMRRPPAEAKAISNDTGYCRQKLLEALLSAGLTKSDVLGSE